MEKFTSRESETRTVILPIKIENNQIRKIEGSLKFQFAAIQLCLSTLNAFLELEKREICERIDPRVEKFS